MDYELSDEGITIWITQEELDKVSSNLKDDLYSKSVHIADDHSEFKLPESEQSLADEIHYELRRKEANARRASRRNYVEYTLSGGYYTPSDIKEILRIQNNRCYFTGEKIGQEKKNWELDHLKPVSKGGSSWPNNLAVLTKKANQDKGDRTKPQYWDLLENRHGKEWVDKRKAVAAEVDKKRRIIHQNRRRIFKDDLRKIEKAIQKQYPDYLVSLTLEKDIVTLTIDDAEVCFPKGFPRKRNAFNSPHYFLELASLLAI